MDLIGGQVFLFCLIFWLYCAACGILFPDQGLNLCPLHWKQGALATGLATGPSPKGRYFCKILSNCCSALMQNREAWHLWGSPLKGGRAMDLTTWYLLVHSRLPECAVVCKLPHMPRHPSASCAAYCGSSVRAWLPLPGVGPGTSQVLRNRVPCLLSASGTVICWDSGRRSEQPSRGLHCQFVCWPGPSFAQNQR